MDPKMFAINLLLAIITLVVVAMFLIRLASYGG